MKIGYGRNKLSLDSLKKKIPLFSEDLKSESEEKKNSKKKSRESKKAEE